VHLLQERKNIMTYRSNSLIDAVDFNSLAAEFNGVYGEGYGSYGYGQSSIISNVSEGNSVTASNWSSLQSAVNLVSRHQATQQTGSLFAFTGSTINYSSSLLNNLQNIGLYRLNSGNVGSVSTNSTTNTIDWRRQLIFGHIINFVSGDSARYFFNSGGQIFLRYQHTVPSGSGRRTNQEIQLICNSLGNVCISSPLSGQIGIQNIIYNGVSSTGGESPVLKKDFGYYGLTTSSTVIASKEERRATISVSAKTNGTQQINGDNGSVITIDTTITNQTTETVTGNTTASCSIRFPSTQYLGNTWGAITVNTTSITRS